MDIFYLNLARRPDRRERFLATNSGIASFHRAEAADGKALAIDDLVREHVLGDPPPDYSQGAIGCAMTHKRMWEMCVATARPLTVAEDDAVFNRHFSEKASTLLARLPRNWDIVLWGWNCDSVLHVEMIDGVTDTVLHFGARQLGQRLTYFREKRYDVMPFRLIGAFGTVCYSISPAGAKRLLDRCFPLVQEAILIDGLRHSVPNFGIDVVLNKHYRAIHAYACFPPLVWTENDKSTSDIPIGASGEW